jgi:hypothetical protein
VAHELRNAYRILVGMLEDRRLLLRRGHTWNDNIKINLKSIANGAKWINLVKNNTQWNSFLNMAIKLWVSSRERNFLTS